MLCQIDRTIRMPSLRWFFLAYFFHLNHKVSSKFRDHFISNVIYSVQFVEKLSHFTPLLAHHLFSSPAIEDWPSFFTSNFSQTSAVNFDLIHCSFEWLTIIPYWFRFEFGHCDIFREKATVRNTHSHSASTILVKNPRKFSRAAHKSFFIPLRPTLTQPVTQHYHTPPYRDSTTSTQWKTMCGFTQLFHIAWTLGGSKSNDWRNYKSRIRTAPIMQVFCRNIFALIFYQLLSIRWLFSAAPLVFANSPFCHEDSPLPAKIVLKRNRIQMCLLASYCCWRATDSVYLYHSYPFWCITPTRTQHIGRANKYSTTGVNPRITRRH